MKLDVGFFEIGDGKAEIAFGCREGTGGQASPEHAPNWRGFGPGAWHNCDAIRAAYHSDTLVDAEGEYRALDDDQGRT